MNAGECREQKETVKCILRKQQILRNNILRKYYKETGDEISEIFA